MMPMGSAMAREKTADSPISSKVLPRRLSMSRPTGCPNATVQDMPQSPTSALVSQVQYRS
ncbi:MAG TPA: hypothetical protein DCP73_08665 [Chloroflexi bacterium]|nr:hypothetical protein [Chloroflexota bacterium]